MALTMSISGIAQNAASDSTEGVRMQKGVWFAGGTISLGSRKAENENQLFVYNVNQKKQTTEVRVDAGYLIRENVGIGLGALYGRIKEINTQKASDGTLTDNNIAESYYAFRPFVKNFIPLGKSHRFYVVIPTELQIGFGSTVKEATTNAVLTRTYTKSTYYGIAMRPGLLIFMYKNFGFEVNVGALGLNSRVDKGTVTGQPDSKVVTHDLDLKINILNLSLGFSGYF
jgi:hypothetical protein